MKRSASVWLYRVSAALLLFFAVGHTLGFLSFEAPTAAGKAVYADMAATTFDAGGRVSSYRDFYVGFGLSVSAYLCFAAYLAWYLGRRASRTPVARDSLAWVLVALQAAILVLTGWYFSIVPTTLSALTLATTALAAWLARNDGSG